MQKIGDLVLFYDPKKKNQKSEPPFRRSYGCASPQKMYAFTRCDRMSHRYWGLYLWSSTDSPPLGRCLRATATKTTKILDVKKCSQLNPLEFSTKIHGDPPRFTKRILFGICALAPLNTLHIWGSRQVARFWSWWFQGHDHFLAVRLVKLGLSKLGGFTPNFLWPF